MIDERQEEQASLYVLGALSPEEQRAFEAELLRNAELRQLVEALQFSRDAVAGNVPLVEPQLRARILAQIEPKQKVVAWSPRREPLSLIRILFPWAVAVGLAVVCVFSLWQQGQLRGQLRAQSARADALNQMADGLRAATNQLQQAVVALRETNRLAGLRIAMLNSLLADAPKAVAVSLWDNQRQQGVFVVQNLKPLPAGKDYQLWVMDPKYPTPVSAGVFQVDESGNVRIDFKANKPIATADKFAVTMEPKGGLPTPTLSNLVLLGS
jgi:anti-sigma-K factor RskA